MSERWYGVMVESGANANKFYDITLTDSGDVVATYGRVGAVRPQSHTYPGGHAVFTRKIREKERKGYTKLDVLEEGASASAETLTLAAKVGMVHTMSPTVERLVTHLATMNKHTIETATGGKITFDTKGRATLPGGLLVTTRQIAQAREVLDRLRTEGAADARTRITLLERYLMLIPHAIGMQRGWEDRLLTTGADFEKETDLLDALEASIGMVGPVPDIPFRYRVQEADAETFESVKAAYDKSRLANHPVASLSVKRVFVLTDSAADQVDTYAEKHGNVAWRWHGTMVHNVLNVLRTGLQFKDPGASRSTGGWDFHGALFGPGIYTSSMSTKAAGYGYGTWGGARDEECFVLSAQVSRGWEYRITPERYDWRGSRRPDASGREHRSIEVYSAVNGARNPETIVWETDAVRMRYLVGLGR